MNCCQCQGIEETFDESTVAWELSRYLKQGPAKTTRWMVEAIQSAGIQGASLLDIGGGVGAIQHALLGSGIQTAIDVDASQAYLNAARQEAQRRGLGDRVSFLHGNFIELAPDIPPADIVTLDRVVCCFPDMERLVGLSAEHARRLVGLVFPRDAGWIKIGVAIANFTYHLRGRHMLFYAHPTRSVEAILTQHGFHRSFYQRAFLWQVAVYSRE